MNLYQSQYLTCAELAVITELLNSLADLLDGTEISMLDIQLVDSNGEPAGQIGYREPGWVLLLDAGNV